jgi:hypothetical protein
MMLAVEGLPKRKKKKFKQLDALVSSTIKTDQCHQRRS